MDWRGIRIKEGLGSHNHLCGHTVVLVSGDGLLGVSAHLPLFWTYKIFQLAVKTTLLSVTSHMYRKNY